MNIEHEVYRRIKELNKFKNRLAVVQTIAESDIKVNRACKVLGVPKSTYYQWKKKYELYGKEGLKRQKPIASNHPNQIPQDVVDKVIELRKIYHLGSMRISWYLQRYHEMSISESSVTRIFVRNGLNRLPKTASKRTVHTKRYAKKVPGHQVQVDVKFANLKDSSGEKIRRYQFTAIDDATRIRALKMYKKHNQSNAIDFIDYVIEKFPFRIHTVRTDRGHEFQAGFHWHVLQNSPPTGWRGRRRMLVRDA